MAKRRKEKDEAEESAFQVGNTKTSDEMSQILADAVNGIYDYAEPVAAVLGDGTLDTGVNDWISTGNDMLDLKISNRPNGGIPVSKITEIKGWQAAGKSLLCGHILANTQKKGGVAVFIDTEAALSKEYMTAIGVDINKLVYIQHELIEDCYSTIEKIIETIRNQDSERLVCIVLDSVAAATTKIEMDADFDKDGWSTAKAIINSKAMRKLTGLIAKKKIAVVVTNQLREKLGVMFGNKNTTSGGRAIGFHASVRLDAKAVGKIKRGEEVIGVKTEVVVEKTRIGPPARKCKFDIYFMSGIDNYGSWLTELRDAKVIKGTQTLSFDMNDEEIGFKAAEFSDLLESRPEVKEFLYTKLCELNVMKYTKRFPTEDEIKIDTEEDVQPIETD